METANVIDAALDEVVAVAALRLQEITDGRACLSEKYTPQDIKDTGTYWAEGDYSNSRVTTMRLAHGITARLTSRSSRKKLIPRTNMLRLVEGKKLAMSPSKDRLLAAPEESD